MNDRSQTILRHIVDSYLETGSPIGSSALAQSLNIKLSPATIRNVMAELEDAGFLHAPHVSAGRLPTPQGLQLYVDGLMEIGDLVESDRCEIETKCQRAGQSMTQIMEQATSMLSGLSSAASLVIAPKTDQPVKQVQFVQLDPKHVLIVLVLQNGLIENRVMDVDLALPPETLTMAANYLNSKLEGRTLSQTHKLIHAEIAENRATLDTLTADLVKKGLALAPQAGRNDSHLIIRGQSHLLGDVKAIEDLEKARHLLAALEEQDTISQLIESTQEAEGIQIYIGAENKTFEHSGWSMVISPYKSGDSKIIGAIGVIGPLRLNYSRIIPIVDYTSKVITKLIE